MKRKILLTAAILICLALVTTGTLAYYTSRETAHNVITSGAVEISVVEKTQTADGTLADFPAGGISGVMPGTRVSKIVTVANTGPASAWVRARVDITILSADGDKLPLTAKVGDEELPMVTFQPGEDWLESEGCYYYKASLAPKDSTTPLLRQVEFPREMGNEYQGATVHVTVCAQAVQAANNPVPDGGTVADVPGWPGWEEGGSTP